MAFERVRAADKLAFFEDLATDPTLSDLQKRMIGVIAKNWQQDTGHSECSLTFIATGAGTTKKMAAKYAASLIDSGRVAKKQGATYTTSTLWTVNWFFRGSAWTRANHDGKPILDCRQESPSVAQGESPGVAQGGSAGGPLAGGPIPSLKGGDTSPPLGCDRLMGDRKGGVERDSEKRSPHALPPGYARWLIVHAEFEDDDTFHAHLKSGRDTDFHLRRDVESDEYADLDEAMGIEGDPASLIGKFVAMSTNRSGAKSFRRATPEEWQFISILEGEAGEDGSAMLSVDYGNGRPCKLSLSPIDADRLVAACGSEAGTIGARVRFRLLPDDSFQFALVEAAAGGQDS